MRWTLAWLSLVLLAAACGSDCEAPPGRSCPALPTMMEGDELVEIEIVYLGGEAGRSKLMTDLMAGGIGYFEVVPTVMNRAPKESAFFARVGRTKAREVCSHPNVASATEPVLICGL